jgi:hypothetical protein
MPRAKAKSNPVLDALQDQINERIHFGVLLIELKTIGAKLGFNVQIASGNKKTRKPAKKAAKRVKAKKARRQISAAGRKHIAKAQKARWAKVHAKQKAAKKTAKKAA